MSATDPRDCVALSFEFTHERSGDLHTIRWVGNPDAVPGPARAGVAHCREPWIERQRPGDDIFAVITQEDEGLGLSSLVVHGRERLRREFPQHGCRRWIA